MKTLNKKLKKILSETKPSWDVKEKDKIDEINNAIKSKYGSTKKYVIKKYEEQNNIEWQRNNFTR